MGTKKLTAIWQLIKPRRTLEAKMRLVLKMQEFYAVLAQDLEDTARDAGELHTLQALRAITEEKMENER